MLVTLLANIFSHFGVIFSFCWCLLMLMFSALQKSFKGSIMSHSFPSAFISFALGDGSVKKVAMIYVRECFAYVLFLWFYGVMSFISIFKSFWDLFLYIVWGSVLNLGDFNEAVSFPTLVVEKNVFLHCISLPPVLKINCTYRCVGFCF